MHGAILFVTMVIAVIAVIVDLNPNNEDKP